MRNSKGENRYELICIDMFQTLVDVNTRIPFIWKRILKDKYSEELGERCAKLVSTKVINKFHERVNKEQRFINLKTLFAPCFLEISRETCLDFNPEEAVGIFLDEHSKAKPYEDAIEFFQLIGDSIPVCLVSDADNEMIVPLLERFKFDKVFISEEMMSYKNDPESRIFREMLNYYRIKPERIIHIGDSSSDIIGANKLGIRTCWIDRYGLGWKYNISPDYTVNSLIKIIDILGLGAEDAAV